MGPRQRQDRLLSDHKKPGSPLVQGSGLVNRTGMLAAGFRTEAKVPEGRPSSQRSVKATSRALANESAVRARLSEATEIGVGLLGPVPRVVIPTVTQSDFLLKPQPAPGAAGAGGATPTGGAGASPTKKGSVRKRLFAKFMPGSRSQTTL